MSDPVFGWEPLDALLDDGAEALVCRHWQEVAHHQDKVPLDLDWDEMRRAELAGQFKVFTARLDGVLIGYITFRFFASDRYRATPHIKSDVFWFTPDRRGQGWGMAMFRAARDALPKPCRLQWARKLGVDDERVDRILRNLGLEPMDVVYTGFFD